MAWAATSSWRYIGTAASPASVPEGYLDPAGFLNKTSAVPVYRQVSAGGAHTCAVKARTTPWPAGDNAYGQASPATGSFLNVGAGDYHSYHSCPVGLDKCLACWGRNNLGQASQPAGSFQQVSAGRWHTCALRTDNTLACRGYGSYGATRPPAGQFKQISAGLITTVPSRWTTTWPVGVLTATAKSLRRIEDSDS